MKTKTLLRIERVVELTHSLARFLLPFDAFVALFSIPLLIHYVASNKPVWLILFLALVYLINVTSLAYYFPVYEKHKAGQWFVDQISELYGHEKVKYSNRVERNIQVFARTKPRRYYEMMCFLKVKINDEAKGITGHRVSSAPTLVHIDEL